MKKLIGSLLLIIMFASCDHRMYDGKAYLIKSVVSPSAINGYKYDLHIYTSANLGNLVIATDSLYSIGDTIYFIDHKK